MTAIRKCGNSSIYELVTDTLHENKWPNINCIEGPQATKQKGISSTDTSKSQNYMWDHFVYATSQREMALQYNVVSFVGWAHIQHFWNQGAALCVLSGWRNVTPCIVLSHLLFCMAQNKTLLYMLFTVSKADCNWFAQCFSWISYMHKVVE